MCDSGSGKINQFQSVWKNLWDSKMNMKCAYISGGFFVHFYLSHFFFFLVFLLIVPFFPLVALCSTSFPVQKMRFNRAFVPFFPLLGVYNLHLGTSKAMRDYFILSHKVYMKFIRFNLGLGLNLSFCSQQFTAVWQHWERLAWINFGVDVFYLIK